MMKMLFIAATLFSTALVATTAQAQTGEPLTRAQVRSELVELTHAGYSPASEDASYPSSIQSAEARVAVHDGANASGSGYGPSIAGTRQSGGSAGTGSQGKDIFCGQ
jgi:hypothetical protein